MPRLIAEPVGEVPAVAPRLNEREARANPGASVCAVVLVLALVLGARGQALAHGTSKSFGEWTIEGARAELRINFFAHDLRDAFPSWDGRDLDVIAAHVSSATALAGCTATRARAAAIGAPADEVHVVVSFECASPLQAIDLETHYLPALEPPHLSYASIAAGDEHFDHIFTAAAPRFQRALAPRRAWASLAAASVLVLGAFLALLALRRRRR